MGAEKRARAGVTGETGRMGEVVGCCCGLGDEAEGLGVEEMGVTARGLYTYISDVSALYRAWCILEIV